MSATFAQPPLAERLRTGLFGTWGNTAITVAFVAALLWAAPPLLRWTLIDATWTGDADACAARGGACWAFVREKLRFLVFAFYPYAEQWRAGLALALMFALIGVSAAPRLWSSRLILVWLAALAAVWVLLAGWPGVAPVATSQWGGLPLSILMSVVAFAGAFPIAVGLALGRRSDLVVLRWLSIGFIEFARGVPLVAVLYIAMLVLPLALPTGYALDKLLRAQLAMTLFFSAYLAEIVRAGLQALPPGQAEAARALGLGRVATLRLIVLPQALRSVVPALVTLAIGILQSTSLVAVIGIFDLLNASRAAANDTAWLGFYDEAFAFSALVYFTLCFGASRYSLWLERRLKQGRTRD